MLEAFTNGIPYASKGQRITLAFPLKNVGVSLGALLVARPAKPFRRKEIGILEGLVGHVSLALVAAHRYTVEQWRI